MRRKRKGKMNNQTPTYGRSQYQMPEPNTWVIPVEENVVFDGSDDYQPTLLLLKSYVKAKEDREAGKASPIFNSVSEMKKWVDEQDE